MDEDALRSGNQEGDCTGSSCAAEDTDKPMELVQMAAAEGGGRKTRPCRDVRSKVVVLSEAV